MSEIGPTVLATAQEIAQEISLHSIHGCPVCKVWDPDRAASFTNTKLLPTYGLEVLMLEKHKVT
jgi:hypothetical protein